MAEEFDKCRVCGKKIKPVATLCKKCAKEILKNGRRI